MFKNKVLEEVIITDINGKDHILNWDYIEEFVMPIVKEHPLNNCIIELNYFIARQKPAGGMNQELMISRNNGKWGLTIKSNYYEHFYPFDQMTEFEINEKLDKCFHDFYNNFYDVVNYRPRYTYLIDMFVILSTIYLKWKRDQQITQILK